jgi:ammonia channel protein AmtB
LRDVDDTLGVAYSHGVAGFAGGQLVGICDDPGMALGYKAARSIAQRQASADAARDRTCGT